MKKKMIILKGLQGSGKSKWAREFVSKDPLRWVRFGNDDIKKKDPKSLEKSLNLIDLAEDKMTEREFINKWY